MSALPLPRTSARQCHRPHLRKPLVSLVSKGESCTRKEGYHRRHLSPVVAVEIQVGLPRIGLLLPLLPLRLPPNGEINVEEDR